MENTQIPKTEAARSENENERQRNENAERRASMSSTCTESNHGAEALDITQPEPTYAPTHIPLSSPPPFSPSLPPPYQSCPIHNHAHSAKPHPYTLRPSSFSTFTEKPDVEALYSTPFYSPLSLKNFSQHLALLPRENAISRRRTCKIVFLGLWVCILIAMVVLGLGFTVGKWGEKTQRCTVVPGHMEGGALVGGYEVCSSS